MSAHLTDEDLTMYLAGEETARIQSHLDECAACTSEARRVLDMVDGTRARVESLTAKNVHFWIRQRNDIRSRVAVRKTGRPSWILAAAMAVLLIASTFMFHTQEPRPLATQTFPQSEPMGQVVNDDALLSSVNDAIERDVPSALAPLQQLAYEREQAEKQSNRRN